jgi:hypothetical protein
MVAYGTHLARPNGSAIRWGAFRQGVNLAYIAAFGKGMALFAPSDILTAGSHVGSPGVCHARGVEGTTWKRKRTR